MVMRTGSSWPYRWSDHNDRAVAVARPGRTGTDASPGSGPRGALHVQLEARSVVADPALLAGGGDHVVPALGPVRCAALRGGGVVQRLDRDEPGLGVLQPAEAGLAQRLVGLLVGHLAQGQVQSREVVDVHDLHLGHLVGAAHHLDDHIAPPAGAFSPKKSAYTCQGKRVKSGSRFSRKASRPSTASSAM